MPCYDALTEDARSRTDTLDALVISLCSDYFRRAEVIFSEGVDPRCSLELRYLNFTIFDAAAEIVGERLSETYIREIGMKIGFARSSVDGVGETTYKHNKSRIKEVIALKLHLK